MAVPGLAYAPGWDAPILHGKIGPGQAKSFYWRINTFDCPWAKSC